MNDYLPFLKNNSVIIGEDSLFINVIKLDNKHYKELTGKRIFILK
jgi:hypothetical protein